LEEKNLSKLLSAIEKRDALHAKGQKNGDQSTKIKLGEAFESEDWIYDSLDYFGKAQSNDKILSLQKKAADEGNVFLVLKAQRFLGDESTNVLELATQMAEKNGMIRYAISGYEKLGDEKNALRLAESIKDEGSILLEDSGDVFIPDSVEE